MLVADLVWFVLRWGVVGSIAVTIYLIVAWQTGLLATDGDEDGELRANVRLSSVLTGVGALLIFLALLVVADVTDLLRHGADLPFARLYALNYLVYVFWLLYDTIVIDILIVVIWHPDFLKLPDPESHGSIAYHLRTIPRGLIFGAFVTGVATSIVWLFFR